MSRLTRFPVGGEHLRNGGGMGLRRGCEHLLNCTRDSHKGDTTFEECLYGHLVGGVQGNAVGSALFRGLKGQAQAGEALEIGRLEVQMAQGGQVEGERGGRPLRLGQRVEDGQAHVGDGNLRQDRAVDVLHQRVHGGLGMDRDPDLAGGTSKRRQASMISSPLFSMVAESMVMRRPMTQVGCLSACSGVMVANWSSGSWRNGPPEAVSQMV